MDSLVIKGVRLKVVWEINQTLSELTLYLLLYSCNKYPTATEKAFIFALVVFKSFST